MDNISSILFLLDSWQVKWNVRSGQHAKQIDECTMDMVGASLPRSPLKSRQTRDLTACPITYTTYRACCKKQDRRAILLKLPGHIIYIYI